MDANRHEKGTPGALPRLRGRFGGAKPRCLSRRGLGGGESEARSTRRNVGGVAGVCLANLRYSPQRQSGGQFASKLTFAYCCLKLF